MTTQLGSAYGRIVIDASGVTTGIATALTGLQRLEAQVTTIGHNVSRVGDQLVQNLTVPLVGVGVASGKMAMDFEESMQHIVGLVGVSQDQVNAWRDDLQKLGPAVGKGPKELADALYFVTSSGLSGSQALDAVEQSARAASAGLGSTAIVADAVTSAMNAYRTSNLTAAQATDILVATVREGKGEADTIAPALGRVIPIAAQLGIRFDEVGAALAGMTLVGFDAAEAGTNLSGIMSALLKPSKQAADVMAEFGLSGEMLRQTLKEKGLLGVLTLLRDTIGEDDEALAKIFPNIRGFRGMLSLVGTNAEQVTGIFARMTNTTGDADKAFEAAAQTAKFKFNAALAEGQTSLIKLGDAVLPAVIPVLQELAATLGRIADWFSKLPASTQETIVKVLALVAALGPVLAIGGRLLTTLGSLMGVFNGLAKFVLGTVVNFGKLVKTGGEVIGFLAEAGVYGLAAVGAIAALAASIVILIKFLDAASRAARATNEELIAMATSNTGNVIEDAFNRAGASFELMANGSGRLRDVFVAHQDEMRKKLLAGEITLEDYNTEIERSAKVAGVWSTQFVVGTGNVTKIDKAVKILTADQVRLARITEGYADIEEIRARRVAASATATDALASSVEDETAAALAAQRAQAALNADVEAGGAMLDNLSALIDGQVGPAYEDWKQKSDELIGKQQELQTEFKKTPGALRRTEIEGELAGIATALEENAQAYDERLKRILFDMAAEQLAMNGMTTAEAGALNALALKFGLIDQATADMTTDVLRATEQLAKDQNVENFVDNLTTDFDRAKTRAAGVPADLAAVGEAYNRMAQDASTAGGGVVTATATMADQIGDPISRAQESFGNLATGVATAAGTVNTQTAGMQTATATAVSGMASTFQQYGPGIGTPLLSGVQTMSFGVIDVLNGILEKVAEVIASFLGIQVPNIQLPGGSGGGGSTGGTGGSTPAKSPAKSPTPKTKPACFTGETLIALTKWSQKPIEQITVGDDVLAFEPETRQYVSGTVTAVQQRTVEERYQLRFESGALIEVTGEHPFYLPDHRADTPTVHGEFVRARDLRAGDTLSSLNEGQPRPDKLVQVLALTGRVEVYNFNVEPWHTYVAGGFVVHNVKLGAGGAFAAGERIVINENPMTRPEVLVPSQPGYVLTRQDAQAALRGAAGGPSGGDAYTFVIDDHLTGKVLMDQVRRRRLARSESRLFGV